MTNSKTIQQLILKKLDNQDSILTKREIQYMLNTVNKDDSTEIAEKFLIGVESADEGFRIDDQMTKQGLDWLKKERRKGKNKELFEEETLAGIILDHFDYFSLRGFREVNLEKGRKFTHYVPNWMVFSNNQQYPEFEYHNFGELVITG